MGAIICSHVLDASRPILLVAHDQDGWNFACGCTDHDGADDFYYVHVAHLATRDPSLVECADLETGHVAERASPVDAWVRQHIPADEA